MNVPRFDFYPSDWLGDTNVQAMSLEVEGAYIRLLAHEWQSGDATLPNEPEKLARFLRVSRREFSRIWRTLTTGKNAVFFLGTDGNWRNPRLVKEWEKALRRAKQASEAASSRWAPHGVSTAETACEGDADAFATQGPEHPARTCGDDAPHQPSTNNQETKTETRARACDVSAVVDEFERVFAGVWKRRPKLTDSRRRHIEARLRSFSLDDLVLAMTNLRANAWNCGENPQGRIYATIDFLMRSDEQIELWMQQTGPRNAAPRIDGLDWTGVSPEDITAYRDSGRHRLTQEQVDVLKTRVGVDVVYLPDDDPDEPP